MLSFSLSLWALSRATIATRKISSKKTTTATTVIAETISLEKGDCSKSLGIQVNGVSNEKMY